MRTFFSYREEDSDIVHRVKRLMLKSAPEIVALWEESVQDFLRRMDRELHKCSNFVLFLADKLGEYQRQELDTFWQLKTEGQSSPSGVPDRRMVIVCLCDREREDDVFLTNEITRYGRIHRVRLPDFGNLSSPTASVTEASCVSPSEDRDSRALPVAKELTEALGIPWIYDGLPADPHLFDYEKDIIAHYQDALRLFPNGIRAVKRDDSEPQRRIAIYEKWLKGCPAEWPDVARFVPPPDEDPKARENPLDEEEIGKYRPVEARVLVKALRDEKGAKETAFTFPEAGPRGELYFRPDQDLKVAIMVSGGIAPGINAVIDGIVQRHWKYAKGRKGRLAIHGLTNGFLSKGSTDRSVLLKADKEEQERTAGAVFTPDHAHEGGSIIGTSRVEELLRGEDRIKRLERIDENLEDVDILYIIGGDGSMKAAHALYEISCKNSNRERKLSVVAIPKTMDNDVLWVWQSFGFLSAVEKAREVIEHLSTEVQSNPRLCIVQLFGSDSGFVVSHAVLASATGHCILALIPEVDFSMQGILGWIKEEIKPSGGRPPRGIVVMAETAVPTDAMTFSKKTDCELTGEEKRKLKEFDDLRKRKKRIEGQTEDALRSAGLKIVKFGLRQGLKDLPGWKLLRVVTNEPRWQLRAIPPSCSDVIIGQRLGTLAVDNAMAGYTDFMISQWLTEYVLVPLKLVVLGRKRIPQDGIFWKSVLAKTGQPADLVSFPPKQKKNEKRKVRANDSKHRSRKEAQKTAG